MAFQAGGEPEHGRVVEPVSAVAHQGARQQHPGHHGGGRRAEAHAVRDGVRAAQREAAALLAELGKGRVHRADDEMALVAGHVGGADARDLDLQTRPRPDRTHVVVPREREAQRVEARPEVGTRRGNADVRTHLTHRPDRRQRPSADAAAATSAGTVVVEIVMPDNAVSMSFRPLPVTVQTTS